MGVNYGPKPVLLDNFKLLDSNKWTTFGESYGDITVNNGELCINNTSNNSSYNMGIYSNQNFPIGTKITVRSKNTVGRHSFLIGIGLPSTSGEDAPHSTTGLPGCTWYGRADGISSIISWRDENNNSGYTASCTQDLRNYQVLSIWRKSSSEINIYRNNILEHSLTGLVLNNEYPVYFWNDGYYNPVTSYIDYISVVL